jgi:hypothetical protein
LASRAVLTEATGDCMVMGCPPVAEPIEADEMSDYKVCIRSEHSGPMSDANQPLLLLTGLIEKLPEQTNTGCFSSVLHHDHFHPHARYGGHLFPLDKHANPG